MSKSKPVPQFPLRLLVATLLFNRDPKTDLVSETEIAELQENGETCYRGEYHIEAELKRYGIEAFSVGHEIESGGECDGYHVNLLFVRGQETVYVDLDCPGYCDDESDAALDAISEVMAPDQARTFLEQELVTYRQSVEEHFKSIGKKRDELFTKLAKAA